MDPLRGRRHPFAQRLAPRRGGGRYGRRSAPQFLHHCAYGFLWILHVEREASQFQFRLVLESKPERLAKRRRLRVDQRHATATVSPPVREELVDVGLLDIVIPFAGVESLPFGVQNEPGFVALHQADIRIHVEKGLLVCCIRCQRPHWPLRAHREVLLISAEGGGYEILEHVLHGKQ